MKKTTIFLLSILLLPTALAYGGWGEEGWGEGGWGFGKPEPEAEVTSDSGGGGGGGGGAFSKSLAVNRSFKAVLVSGLNSYFKIGGERHRIRLTKIASDFIELEIKSKPIIVGLYLNETKTIEFEEGYLEIYFQKIYRKTVTLMLTRLEKPFIDKPEEEINISEEVEEIKEVDEETTIDETEDETEEPALITPKERKISVGMVVIGIIILIVGALIVVYVKYKNAE